MQQPLRLEFCQARFGLGPAGKEGVGSTLRRQLPRRPCRPLPLQGEIGERRAAIFSRKTG